MLRILSTGRTSYKAIGQQLLQRYIYTDILTHFQGCTKCILYITRNIRRGLIPDLYVYYLYRRCKMQKIFYSLALPAFRADPFTYCVRFGGIQCRACPGQSLKTKNKITCNKTIKHDNAIRSIGKQTYKLSAGQSDHNI